MTNRRLRGEEGSKVSNTESQETKKRKILIEDNKNTDNGDHENSNEGDTKEITSRREVLNFKIKGTNNE